MLHPPAGPSAVALPFLAALLLAAVPAHAALPLAPLEHASLTVVATIQGVVLDGDTGTPIPSAIVQLVTDGELRSQQADCSTAPYDPCGDDGFAFFPASSSGLVQEVFRVRTSLCSLGRIVGEAVTLDGPVLGQADPAVVGELHGVIRELDAT